MQHIFAIDLGYNRTKATDGARTISFPSVVGSQTLRNFALQNGDGVHFTTPRTVSVGEAAINYAMFATPRRDREWIHTDMYEDLFLAAISELSESSGQCRIVTGLPVKYYSDKDALMDRLKKVHSFTRLGKSPQTWNVSAIHVLMQPVGTLLRESLTNDGQIRNSDLIKGHVGIIDIGGKTTNFVHVHKLNTIDHECTHIDEGGWSVVKLVRDYLDHTCPGLSLRDHEIVQAIIDRQIRYDGAAWSLAEIVNESADALSASICNVAHSLWSLKKLDAIAMTGGGSLLINQAVQQEIPRAYTITDPVMANVQGYWHYGVYQQNKGK